ncbi:MAG: hypothetical protein C0467_13885 [Planctomycetaceae bacterium]|nr:hypothetical protein [Planctomycetaceae bacterium]
MRIRLLPLLALLAMGCDSEASAPTPPVVSLPAIGTAFDATKCGRITGRVTWKGPIPVVADFPNIVWQADGTYSFLTAKNPYAPRVNPKTLGLEGAVVWLQGVPSAAAHPWDLPPVSVEINHEKITVVQGDRRGRVGFVRPGDSITVSSTDANYHVLRGRGDAFFSLTLPEPGKPVTRTLTTCGRVELSSGSGKFWSRGDLFVADHPYFAVTDADGRFVLDRVPAGTTKLVVWQPGWETARTERDPDSTVMARIVYTPPIERSTVVQIVAGQTQDTSLSIP